MGFENDLASPGEPNKKKFILNLLCNAFTLRTIYDS